MKVTLINHTPEPEKMAAIAARMCYTPKTATEMMDNLTDEEIGRMVMKGIESHHDSLFEHITFTFVVEGVSRVLSHQFVRHRVGTTFHQKSQRHVKSSIFKESVTPPSIAQKPEALKEFRKILREIDTAYEKLIAMGISKDDARFVYPNATETQLMVTMNARQLIHFFSLRCCKRASWEIQQMANLMLEECRNVSPLIFNHVGPNCYLNNGRCPEGEMTCGDCSRMTERYLPEVFKEFMKESN